MEIDPFCTSPEICLAICLECQADGCQKVEDCPSGHTSSGFSQISVQFFLHSLSSLTATRPSSHSYGYIMHFLFSGQSFITGTSGTTGKCITIPEKCPEKSICIPFPFNIVCTKPYHCI